MNPTGKPRDPKSNTGRARELFEANPGGLTPNELGRALGLTKLQTYTVMRNLKKQGVCESVRIIRAVKQ